ncbi:MAG: class I SAM-dependent methyltransferase, partial [Chloroflexota bacterium]|nr:class I SAM-dependent methyltransferase [Chloroflexota bacterium]
MSTFYNRTRRSTSIPRKLVRERKAYLIPIYFMLLTSGLASEGIRNSGSYRFADHIYAGRPQGRFFIGVLLDRLLLSLPSARAFRSRYLYAKEEIRRLVQDTSATSPELAILAVPSGCARELFEVAEELRASDPSAYSRIRWHGLDLDDGLIDSLARRSREEGHQMSFWTGDALSEGAYRSTYDMVISMGFTEFLDDDVAIGFYRIVHEHLKPGGRFVTSGLRRH